MKVLTGICLYFFLLNEVVTAGEYRLGGVYTDEGNGKVSVIVEMPPGITPTLSNFRLLNDSKVIAEADSLKSFGESSRKLGLAILVDASGSIGRKAFDDIQVTLLNLLDSIPDEVFISVVSFADDVKVESDLSHDRPILTKAVYALKAGGKKTVLYDALYQSLNYLKDKEELTDYRRILIISDGKDEGSDKTEYDVIDLSEKLGIPIDAVGYGVIQIQYREALRKLANKTKGRFVEARTDVISIQDAVFRLYNDIMKNRTFVVDFQYSVSASNEWANSTGAEIEILGTGVQNLKIPISDSIPVPTAPIQTVPVPTVPDTNNFWIFVLLSFLLLALLIGFLITRRRNKINVTPVTDEPTDQPVIIPDPYYEFEPLADATHYSKRQTVISQETTDIDHPEIVLSVKVGPLKGQQFVMKGELFRIGANTDNDMVLANDEYASGLHAVLCLEQGEILLSDQNSKNGIFLNDQLIDDNTRPIVPGDVIRIGSSIICILNATDV